MFLTRVVRPSTLSFIFFTTPLEKALKEVPMSKDKINDVVMNHNLVHLATVDADGQPHVRGVDYAAEEGAGCIYFVTQKTSRKVQHIMGNQNISFVIDHDCPSWEMLQELIYIKGTGVANIVEDPEEMQKAFGLLMQKFPFLSELPGEPTDFVGVRIDFKEVLLTDNTISFGDTETVNY
jgi:general stress protein 26